MAPKTLIEAGVDRHDGVAFPTPPARRRDASPNAPVGALAQTRRPPGTPRVVGGLRRAIAARADVSAGLAVGAVATLGLTGLALAIGHETAPRGDDLIYERMARDPLGTHTFPFAYRIGIPWIVHVLPFSHTLSFELLAWGAAGGAAGVAFLLMRHLGSSRWLAGVLALALALSPPMLVVALRAGRNPDAATTFFLMAATLFAVQRRGRALAVTLLLGTLVREAELFAIPFAYALWAERWWDRRSARRALEVGAPAVLAYVALRVAIPTVGAARVPGYGGALLGERIALLRAGVEDGLTQARRMLSVYGPLWVLAPVALARMRFARRGLVLVAACVVAMTFALDWGRMIFLAAPVFYPAGAFVLERHPRWRAPALAAFAMLIAAYAIHMADGGLRAGILDANPPPYPLR